MSGRRRAGGRPHHPAGFNMQGAIHRGTGTSDRPAHLLAHAALTPPPAPLPQPAQSPQQPALGLSGQPGHGHPAVISMFQSMPMTGQYYPLQDNYPAIPVSYGYNYIHPVAVGPGTPVPQAAAVPSYPVYYRSAPIPQHTYDSQVATYRYQTWLRSPAGQKAKSEADTKAAKKKKEDEEALEKKKKADEKAAIAAAGWNTMYFSGGEDTRQTMIRAGLNGVSCEVGEWKWVGEPGNGGFRICEVRKKKDVQPPKGAESMTPALAWHLMQGVSGPPSWGYGPAHGTFQPPQPSGGSGIPRYAGGSGNPAVQQSYPAYAQSSGGAYSYDCQCQECAAVRAYGAHPHGRQRPGYSHHLHYHHRH